MKTKLSAKLQSKCNDYNWCVIYSNHPLAIELYCSIRFLASVEGIKNEIDGYLLNPDLPF